MLIVGAKGFAKEVLEVLHQTGISEEIAFFDDMNSYKDQRLYAKFPVLNSEHEVRQFFNSNGGSFTLGLGTPAMRLKLYNKFMQWGGEFTSTISPFSHIGSYGTIVSEGCNIMTGTILTNDIKVSRGCLINLNCTVGHDTIIGEFAELCPGVNISGNCNLGKLSFLGTNAVVLPGVTIGENATIGAGAVVTKDVPANSMAVGIPAKIISKSDKV